MLGVSVVADRPQRRVGPNARRDATARVAAGGTRIDLRVEERRERVHRDRDDAGEDEEVVSCGHCSGQYIPPRRGFEQRRSRPDRVGKSEREANIIASEFPEQGSSGWMDCRALSVSCPMIRKHEHGPDYEMLPAGVPLDETDVSLRAYFAGFSDERLAGYDPTWPDDRLIEWDGNFRSDGCLMLVCCERDVDVSEYRRVLEEHMRFREIVPRSPAPRSRATPSSEARERLEDARRSLLDLSRRNRLLNFRPRGRSALEVVDEVPEEVFRILVAEGRTMQFRALEEAPEEPPASATAEVDTTGAPPEECETDAVSPQAPATSAAADAGTIDTPSGEDVDVFELAEIDEPDLLADRHVDRILQTPLPGPRLQGVLLHLAREAQSALQEQGSNVLYLAIGFLKWVDGETDETEARAPLLLVPVELARRTARHRHAVMALDEDVVVNPVLIELCRRRFRLDLPEFDADRDRPVEAFLDAVRTAITGMRGWDVDDDMHLGLFTFAKLLMYVDLQDENWPADSPLSGHPLVRALCGVGLDAARENGDGVGDGAVRGEQLDQLHPRDTFQVLDADSTQQLAILGAKRGDSMVIHGPPGTGKSQTITNIIAECLAAGKTVLFVAEKAAALEVVERRLAAVGLGDFVSELHSRKASKRKFLEHLARAVSRIPPDADDRVERLGDDLARVRGALNDYVRALHDRVEPLGLSPFEAIGACLDLETAPEAPVDLGDVTSWDRGRLEAAVEVVELLAAAVTRTGDPGEHPWRGVACTALGLADRQQLDRRLGAVQDALDHLDALARDLAAEIGSSGIDSLRDARRLAGVLEAVSRSPALDAGRVASSTWDSPPAEVGVLVDSGRRLASLRVALAERWQESAERVDWAPVHERIVRRGSSLLRFLSPSWWGDRRLVRFHLAAGRRPPREVVRADLELFREVAELRGKIERLDARGLELFAGLWLGDRSDWDALSAYALAVSSVRKLIADGLLSSASLEALARESGGRRAAEAAVRLNEAVGAVEERWAELAGRLDASAGEFLGDAVDAVRLATFGERVREGRERPEALDDWLRFRSALVACDESDARVFVEWALGDGLRHGPASWARAFRRQFIRLWLDGVTRARAPLRDFRGPDHERLIQRFQELDREWLALSRRRLAARLAERRPAFGRVTSNNSGLGILRAEMRRKRRIKPIRRLLASPAGAAIQRITPCFMMSPISVAQFLEPGRLDFDVVIFDEASQVEPADALGAVARGRQLILVGDERQLPPTSFFRPTGELFDEEEDDEAAAPASDLESVLALGQAYLPRSETLRWHYRSRHHSLVEFSNNEFYGRELRVFPSPVRHGAGLGLAFHHVPDGIYSRGRGRFNREEARAVAREVMRHARETPELSLGVAAFSIPQQRAIEDEIELLRRAAIDDSSESFFDANRDEPFFVKNLETVQGDERDVMFLSVGYGRDETGAMHQNFGPLNRDGGWRRLNVLVTRARRRCVLFSSITEEDIRVTGSTPRGVRALNGYLHHARAALAMGTGDGDAGGGSGDGVDRQDADRGEAAGDLSDFVLSVRDRLRRRGWEVHGRVGGGSLPIVLAVVDRERPDRYALGVECDGEVYRGSGTARDRDRLRPEVLGGLGWRLHRTWSPDWIRQPRTMENEVVALLEQLARDAGKLDTAVEPPSSVADVASGEAQDGAQPRADAGAPSLDVESDALPAGVVPYRRHAGEVRGARAELLASTPAEVGALITEIVAVEGPVHREELFRVAASRYGTRAAGDVKTNLSAALEAVTSSGAVSLRGDFVWPARLVRAPVRWRGDGDAVTDADLIDPEEAAEAAILVARNEFGLPATELPAAAMRALGFRRVGPQLAALGERGVRLALERRLLRDDGSGNLLAVESAPADFTGTGERAGARTHG